MSDPLLVCAHCREPYEPRQNLADGGTLLLFPTCKHKFKRISDCLALDRDTLEPIETTVRES